jgi:hypothetical protein
MSMVTETCRVLFATSRRWFLLLRAPAVFLFVGIALGCFPGKLHAQDITGALYGSVTDANGALVPNAKVTIVNVDRGFTRTTTTDHKGEYSLPQLPIGTYEITVIATSFETYVKDGVIINVSETARADAKLTAGMVTTVVTVEDSAPGLDTRSATIGSLIDNTSVQELPVDGNNIVNLTALLPGITSINAPASFTGDRSGPTYSASGARVAQNLFLLDGIIYNNLFRNTGNTYPPRQSIAEIQVLLNNYGPEYGRNAGSIFSAITKSGTSVYHGQFWEIAKNTAFNATNFLTGKLANKLIQNQFGANFGGPILKDRLFFFATYQGFRYANTASSELNVLTSKEFTNATTNAVFPTTVYDPQTGAPFPNNTIPFTRFDPTAVAIINAFGLSTPNGELVTIAPAPQHYDLGLMRIDLNLGRQTIDARYYQIDAYSSANSGNLYTYDTQAVFAPSLLTSVTDTFVVTPNLLNVARIAYRRSTALTTPSDSRTLSTFGANFPVFGPPTLPFISLTSLFTLSNTSNTYQQTANENVEIDDSVSWSHGPHSAKIGGQYLRLQYENITGANTQGDFYFTGAATGHTTATTTTIGPSAADFLLGLPSTLTVASPILNQGGIQHEIVGYAGDEWRLLSNFTLSYGLRYELPLNWYNPKDHWGTFEQGVQSHVIPTAPVGLVFPGDPGISRGIVPTDFKDIGPRFGFSWDPLKKGNLVVRGGAGIFYDAINADIIQNTGQPFQYSYTFSNVYSFTNPLQGQPTIPTSVNLANPQFVGLPTLKFPDAKLTSPYIMQFNFGYQEALPKQVFYEVDYVGRFSRKLFIPYTFNPSLYAPGASVANTDSRRLIQGFGDLEDLATIGTANYNALQVRLTRRMHNITVNGSYAWAHSLDTGSVYDTEAGYLPHPFNQSLDYGASDFNSARVFTLAYVVNLPTLAKHNLFLREILGSWTWSGIYNAVSGLPLNITLGSDVALSTTPNQRPNYLTNPNLPSGRGVHTTISEFFNRDAFAGAATGTYGNVSRNSVTGPAQYTNNMAVQKGFHIPAPREGVVLLFRCDAFGVFNTPNLRPPTGTNLQLGSYVAGSGASTSFGQISNTTGERQLQLQLMLTY